MATRGCGATAPIEDGSGRSRPPEERLARAELIAAISAAMDARDLSQVQASKLLHTDQPTLSKVLSGRPTSVSLDKLMIWLVTLGRSVEIRVGPPRPDRRGTLTAVVDERADAKQ
jgi:predicted XRE-type DNA-binding protein